MKADSQTWAFVPALRSGVLRAMLPFLALVSILTSGWAAETSSAGKPPGEPTEISLEDLLKLEIPTVEAASKYKQKTTEAPATVTIITADEVKKYGHRTLADILRTVPGMYVSYDRNYSFLGVRGFNRGDNSRVLLLVDGHRINNSLSDSAFIGTEFILDVDLIDRVEVIRGPGSSLYGNNAFFGVINVITRKGRDTTGNGAEVSGEVASFDTYKGRVTYGNRFRNGLELLLSGSIYDSAGQQSLYYPAFDQRISPVSWARDNGIAEKADDDAFKSFFGSVAFHDFSLEGGFITREKGNPTAPFPTCFNDRRLRTTDDRSFVNLKYAHEFPEVVDVTAQVYYDRNDFTGVYPFVQQGGSLIKVEDVQVGEWWGAEVQLTKRLWERHILTLGGEYRDDFRQEEQFFDASTGAATTPIDQQRQSYGIYFQGDFAVLTNLHFNAGVRFDQYGDFDPAFNPRLALIYNPVGQTVLKAIYGTAFRAPTFNELRANPGVPTDIKPETITTYELVYEQGIGDHLRSSVAGFYNQIDDLIIRQNTGFGSFYKNLNNAEAKGMELALDCFWPSATVLSHETERYLTGGFDEFVAKPFRYEQICECLAKLPNTEFEPAKPPPAGLTEVLSPASLDDIILTAELWQQLSDATERFSATRLEQGLAKLEVLGGDGPRLATQLRRLLVAGDFDRVANVLRIVKHDS